MGRLALRSCITLVEIEYDVKRVVAAEIAAIRAAL
jgi:hypothetical protein